MIADYAAPWLHTASYFTVTGEQTFRSIDYISPTDTSDHRITNKMLFDTPAPVIVWDGVVVCDHHDLAGDSTQTRIECCHLAAKTHFDNT
ncbi:hypothetical protein GCM10011586_27140 [Silvibacterium dinghuense]|nr:hypothetical protein GCM10011586_27140 [Silvibacterium dinghuense]